MGNEYRGFNIETELARFKKIKMLGQGPAPDVLRGLYTSENEAIKAIDQYLLLNPKAKQNVPSEGAS